MSSSQEIHIVATALTFIQQESQRSFPFESGGILIGRVEQGSILVTHATGPGPRAIHSPRRFVRDGDYTQQALNAQLQASGGLDDYLGEWHSHPLSVGPSPQDRESMRWISGNPHYQQPAPIMLLCQRESQGSWTVLAYQWIHSHLRPRTLVLTNDADTPEVEAGS
ncbi:MAG TPA: Mov34/MPN/PAD-1 family protein [Roseiflexaceae bacterium]|nr:Mov34/MPN/PAD-1 family protein [Roseiflexaceae bacterium]